ncbi:signal transduction histidine kinase [Salirhabdus euzebyi]|uniref:histidine kinase n=1 Tax=Salirhabdus euzebyi TaxID=394506 RepID=A0A841Q7R6_9BACI|nr:sensor histidine kinase [Salirhabdus euzebyi]MBB6454470.1 signal transduction histidine kinase [Salirhabdus euzebyi]
MIKGKYYFVLFLLSMLFINYQGLEVEATEKQLINEGYLDLSNSDLDQVLLLEGQWEFYWKQLLVPEDFKTTNEQEKTNYIEAPDVWVDADYTGSLPLSNSGFGTYRLVIHINEEDSNELLSVYIPSVASAYKLWVNGELLAKNGEVGTNRESMKPKSFSKTASFVPHSSEIEIVMQVSNFSQRKGGMWSPLKFGSHDAINKNREMNVIRDIIIASALFALSFYLISHYFFRSTSKLPLFLGVFCFFVSLRTLFVGELLFMYLFPSFSWELSVKIEYLTIYFSFMVLFLFLYYLFPREVNKRIIYLSVAICLLFSLTTLFPAYIYTHFLYTFETCSIVIFIYCIYIVGLAVIRKREGAILNFLSVCFFVIAVIHDIFYYNLKINNSVDLVPIAAGVFLLAQTLIVAKNSSNAFAEVEKLSQEIKETNTLLEQKVADRTYELQERNKQLHHIEQTRKEFFSSVAHEIGTPMQSLQGYVQLLENKVQSEEEKSYVNIVGEKAKLINRLSKDLLDLAKMDEGQFDFMLEEVDAVHLLEHLYNRFEHDIVNEKMNLDLQWGSLPKEHDLLLQIDILRIEQVFSNIIHNATKFTPEGGTITIVGEYEENPSSYHENGIFRILICDNGIGIEKDILPNIFTRFIKGKNSLNKKQGSGLGLAICYEIIKKHDGTISVQSKVGVGSQFSITLPVTLVEKENPK